jgi:hypothetical protein
MSGSATLNPSIQPGYGWRNADSMIVGRTTDRRCSAPHEVSATRSPRALVNV